MPTRHKRILNLSIYSAVLAVVPWCYAIFAELLTPAISTIVATSAYLSCFASIVAAIIVIRKSEQSIRLSQVVLALNLLFILVVIFSLLFIYGRST